MKKRHCEADGFENSKVGPRDGTPDPPKKLSRVLPMSFPLQTQPVLVLRYIQTFERTTTNATDPTRNTAKDNFKKSIESVSTIPFVWQAAWVATV